MIWVVVSLMLSFSFCMSFGLVSGRTLSPAVGVEDVKFQCRLFLLVQALIFGVRVASLVVYKVQTACTFLDDSLAWTLEVRAMEYERAGVAGRRRE